MTPVLPPKPDPQTPGGASRTWRGGWAPVPERHRSSHFGKEVVGGGRRVAGPLPDPSNPGEVLAPSTLQQDSALASERSSTSRSPPAHNVVWR